MADEIEISGGIKETDIVFDCPHCGKSLAIDYRGAGLTIPCSDCGNYVEVPIPEGMELTDIDSTDEEQEIRILNLRRSLSAAEYRIVQLETEMGSLAERRESLERARTGHIRRSGVMRECVAILERALGEMQGAVRDLAEMLASEQDAAQPPESTQAARPPPHPGP